MTWKARLLAGAVVLFLVCNITLLFLKNDKINRTYHVDEWTSVKKQDLLETMPARGVLAPKEEQHFYYENSNGTFKGFLVEKGDEVQKGTGLFEYSPDDITLTKEEFQIEKEKLENEQENLESHISDLEEMQRTLSSAIVEEDQPNPNEYMIQTIERDIYEKELQISRIDTEIEKYEDLIEAADESLLNLTVASEIDGTVKSIKHDLTNPVVTVISNEQKVTGIFSEQEIKKAAEGMKVFITPEGSNKKINGTIEKILNHPTSEPHAEAESRYEFSIAIDESNKLGSFHGEHVDVRIVTNEVIDTLTVPAEAVKKANKGKYTYVIQTNGRVERKKIETGIKVNQTLEVKEGVENGEIILLERPPFLKTGFPFITSMEPKKLKKKDLKELGKKDMLKYAARGLLSR
ncbi:efflux RND transporter periplasmic adaptor subunit [Cytobacillus oceanisediminis]|uniref:efflux RND transporter periplasmic adaptor subunit n=1 Tax=Cytobacillus oceanisediminis TaxID=665099 RepID=UPI002495371A|nr:efflux RND transporter periplasmic adaptor subunit [Cytobacillus oceanisediminis]